MASEVKGRFLNRFLIGTAFVAAGLVAIAVLAPSFIDWSRYRAGIAAQVEVALGYPVELAGDIDFTILPSPALSVRDVRVANMDGATDPAFAVLDSLDVQLAFGALLRGDFQLRHVVLQGLTLNLELLPNGRSNWTRADAAPRAGKAGDLAVMVDNFVVRGATVTYRDPARAIDVLVEGIEAEIAAGGISGPYQADGSFTVAGLPVTFSAQTGALGRGRPAGIRVELAMRDGLDKILFRGTRSWQDDD